MKRILFSLFLLAFLLVNCDSGSENPVDDGPPQSTDDEIDVIDKTPPEIVLPEIPEKVEVAIDLNISINDTSQDVVTKILLDGEEILTTSEKNFVFSLDPFDYSIGNKKIEIFSIDDSGNESTSEISFELKKLLIRIPNPSRGSELELVDVYYSVNDLSGNMIAYKKVEMEEVLDFFADDSFSYKDVTLTRYIIGKSPQSFQFFSSASNLKPGTVLPTDEERGSFREEPGANPDNNVEITMESTYLPAIRSHNATLLSYSGFSGTYTIKYNNLPQNNEAEVLYSFPIVATPISEYEYLLIDDFTKLSYELADFKKPSSSKTIRFPENGDFYSITIDGFYSEADYQSYRYKRIFDNRDEVSKLVDNSLEIPILEEFEVYQRQLSIDYSESKKRFQTFQKGVDTEFFVPDFDISRSDRFVNFTGDYDYSEFFFDKVTMGGDGSFNQFFWSFKNRPTTETLEIPYYNFELPPEVNQELSLKSQSANPDEVDAESFTCEMYKFDATGSYEDIIFFAKDFADGPREDQYSLTLDLK